MWSDKTTDIPPEKTHCGGHFSAFSAVFTACLIFSLTLCLLPYVPLFGESAICFSVPLSYWWVVREGLSALLHQLCFKSLLEATSSAFKYSHLTHPNREQKRAATDPNSSF